MKQQPAKTERAVTSSHLMSTAKPPAITAKIVISHIQPLIPTSTLHFTLAFCWQNIHAVMQSVQSGNRSILKLTRQQHTCFNLDQIPNLTLCTAARTLL